MIDGTLGGPGEQEYLLQARQMQALSLAVHIPLVCFGIAFPAMVVFLEGLWLRTGDPIYKAMAKRWSHAMLILFAIGVVTGTILSFELGLLWPEFMATFGDVFGVAFGLEGFSFFLEAIFIAIYVYGWDRLPPRVHILCRHSRSSSPASPGLLFVISVNGWMNDPTGFRDQERGDHRRQAVRGALQQQHVARAGAHVLRRHHRRGLPDGRRLRGRVAARQPRAPPPRGSGRGAQLRRPGRARAAAGGRLGRSHGGREPAHQARHLRGTGRDREGRSAAHPRHLRGRRGQVRDRLPQAACRCSPTTIPTRPCRAWTRPAPTAYPSKPGSTWCGCRSRRWCSSARFLAALGVFYLLSPGAAPAADLALVHACSGGGRTARRWSL